MGKLIKFRKPRIRITSKGIKIAKPSARIGGAIGLNVSSKGVSGSVKTKAGTYNTKRGLSLHLPGCLLPILAIGVLIVAANAQIFSCTKKRVIYFQNRCEW